ncbi:transaldolase [Acidihalobacter prosperus]
MSQPTPHMHALAEMGQSIWLDYIRRHLIDSGELHRMIHQEGLRGMTSNPTIFDKGISEGHLYDTALLEAYQSDPGQTPQEIFFDLAVDDILAAADQFAEVYRKTARRDGFVSLEVSPDLAHDTDATINEALALREQVNRANLMIKVPGTREGLQAIRQLTEAGVNVNVTLLFSVARYEEVIDAYLGGLEARLEQGLPLDAISSVASFFVSRVDSLIDKHLDDHPDPKALELKGQCAIANARLAYAHLTNTLKSERWLRLQNAGAHPQRLLWASTSTKNPEYPPLLYVKELIGEHTVNTLPPATYKVMLQDNTPFTPTLPGNIDEARARIESLSNFGIDLDNVTEQLENDGVTSFSEAFHHLLKGIATRLEHLNKVNA